MPDFVLLSSIAVVRVTGPDAPRILNNLCTADVVSLSPGEGREAFITDVRGKTLGHVCVYRVDDGFWLVGSGAGTASQGPAIVAHLDRYTLREKSVPTDVSDQYFALLIQDECLARLMPNLGEHGGRMFRPATAGTPAQINTDTAANLPVLVKKAGESTSLIKEELVVVRVPWVPEPMSLCLLPLEAQAEWRAALAANEMSEGDIAWFHQRRIACGFPWFGVDMDMNHLPQELDRDSKAISFTKGCYLGQETVARLDAMGQVQKRLVRWCITSVEPPLAGTELYDGDRVVGKLTSVCAGESPGTFDALGFARRSHFDEGSRASVSNQTGQPYVALVGKRLSESETA